MRNDERNLEARRAAQKLWENSKKQLAEVLDRRQEQRRAEASKVDRLRELRLAKEAADKEVARQAREAMLGKIRKK
ncbi:MAG TPA: hypothetical protein VMC10_19415 [Stellaceae bacterium]|nr:hypothetical protein [Stellaceae bacterium]